MVSVASLYRTINKKELDLKETKHVNGIHSNSTYRAVRKCIDINAFLKKPIANNVSKAYIGSGTVCRVTRGVFS